MAIAGISVEGKFAICGLNVQEKLGDCCSFIGQ